MKSTFVCVFAALVCLSVAAQSNPSSIVDQSSGLPTAQPHPIMPPNFLRMPQGWPFARRAARVVQKAGRRRALPMQGSGFANAVDYSSGGDLAQLVTVADVNGDGKPDLIVANWCADKTCASGSVAVLLGNGDGTFKAATTYGSGAFSADWVAVADVNGDGRPDLVVSNMCSDSQCSPVGGNTLGVLLGNGDGTFQSVVTYAPGGYYAQSVAIADVNGDGKPDLLVAVQQGNNGAVGVLLNNGNGTFRAPVTYGSGGYGGSFSVTVSDVNGDHKPDLLVANACADSTCGSSSVGVLLGNGDGTFQAAATYAAGPGYYDASSVAVADVNGDGKPDLMVANVDASSGSTSSVGVLLGNGDGTFQTVVTYGSGGEYAWSVAIADANGDGKPDLVVANNCASGGACGNGGVIGVLLGNGDGTFQSAVAYGSGGYEAQSVVAADVNGDGKPDLVVANICDTNACSNTGSVGVLVNLSLASTTTTLSSSQNPSNFGQAVTLTATVSSQGFKGSPTGTVTFYDGTTNIGNSPLNVGGVATLTTSTLTVGGHSMTATYSGDANFMGSTSGVLNQVVNQAPTNATASSNVNPAAVNQTVTYIGSVTSPYGNPLTGTVTLKDGSTTLGVFPVGQAVYSTSYPSTGVHPITATYSGDSNNLGSTSPVLNEYIEKLPISTTTVLATSGSPSLPGQMVTFTATVTAMYDSVPNGETVTFYDGTTEIGTGTTNSGIAMFSTSTLPPGTHTIKGTYSGDKSFKPSSGTVKQVVSPYSTTTSLSSNPNPSNYGQNVTLTAVVTTTGPGVPTGKVTFKNGITSLGTATLDSTGKATFNTIKLPVGSDPLTAAYGGDSQNGKSTSPVVTQTVNQAQLSMTLSSSPNPSSSGQPVTFTATLTSNGGLPNGQLVKFVYNGKTLGTGRIANGVAVFSTSSLPGGNDVVTASYAGNVDYSAASANVTQVVQ